MAQKRPRTHITDADESHEADTRARSRRYLLSMAIRITCFVLAIVTTGWVRWACVAGAVFLAQARDHPRLSGENASLLAGSST